MKWSQWNEGKRVKWLNGINKRDEPAWEEDWEPKVWGRETRDRSPHVPPLLLLFLCEESENSERTERSLRSWNSLRSARSSPHSLTSQPHSRNIPSIRLSVKSWKVLQFAHFLTNLPVTRARRRRGETGKEVKQHEIRPSLPNPYQPPLLGVRIITGYA